MIYRSPEEPSAGIHHVSACSSIGVFDSLPAELFLLILHLLDFQSLSRLSRVSLLGKAIVERLPAYKDLITYAPGALNTLRKSRVLSFHPASLLRRTLRSSKCVSCSEFDAYLFLPTFERVCFKCLHSNLAFRMTTLDFAMDIFCLTKSQLKRIPIIYPKTYEYHPRCLVSSKQLKQLVTKKHKAGNITEEEHLLLRYYHEEDNSELPGPNFFGFLDRWGGNNPYRRIHNLISMAFIRFPCVTEAGVDYGRRCRGCRVTTNHYINGWLPTNMLSKVPERRFEDLCPLDAGTGPRLLSAEGFCEHIQHCYGVPHLLTREEEDWIGQHSNQIELLVSI
ncbi:hypothetical protein F4803DRAFT_569774 [Xylaria telfairii]|nr:hypothetical protein F4803DRAFT_569774 [Xylaria telfairii]